MWEFEAVFRIIQPHPLPSKVVRSRSGEVKSPVKVTPQLKSYFCHHIQNRISKPTLATFLGASHSVHKCLWTALSAPCLGTNTHEYHVCPFKFRVRGRRQGMRDAAPQEGCGAAGMSQTLRGHGTESPNSSWGRQGRPPVGRDR